MWKKKHWRKVSTENEKKNIREWPTQTGRIIRLLSWRHFLVLLTNIDMVGMYCSFAVLPLPITAFRSYKGFSRVTTERHFLQQDGDILGALLKQNDNFSRVSRTHVKDFSFFHHVPLGAPWWYLHAWLCLASYEFETQRVAYCNMRFGAMNPPRARPY